MDVKQQLRGAIILMKVIHSTQAQKREQNIFWVIPDGQTRGEL